MESTATKTLGPSRSAAFGFASPQNGSEWLGSHREAPSGHVDVPESFETVSDEALASAGLTPEQIALVRRAEAERERLAAYLRARNAEYAAASAAVRSDDGTSVYGAENGVVGAAEDSEDGYGDAGYAGAYLEDEGEGDFEDFVGRDEVFDDAVCAVCEGIPPLIEGTAEEASPVLDRWVEVISGRTRRACRYALGSRFVSGSGLLMPLAVGVTSCGYPSGDFNPHALHSGRGPPGCR